MEARILNINHDWLKVSQRMRGAMKINTPEYKGPRIWLLITTRKFNPRN